MNDINGVRAFYGLVKKPELSAKEDRIAGDVLAKIREHQRRDRKEQLYSPPPAEKLLSL